MGDETADHWPGQPEGAAPERTEAERTEAERTEPGRTQPAGAGTVAPSRAVGVTGHAPASAWADPEGPPPVPRPETGEPRVDEALSRLDDLTELPVIDHPAVFERVHAQLSEILGELSSSALASTPGRDSY